MFYAVVLPSIDFHDDHIVRGASSSEISIVRMMYSDKYTIRNNSKIQMYTNIAY